MDAEENRSQRRDKKTARKHNRLRADKRTQHIVNSQRKKAEEVSKKKESQTSQPAEKQAAFLCANSPSTTIYAIPNFVEAGNEDDILPKHAYNKLF